MAKQPVHEIRFGLIKACVWENHTKRGTHHVVTVTRLFKNGDQWQESSRFGRDDLPLLAKVADQAHSWIFESKRGEVGTGCMNDRGCESGDATQVD
jgi:hypothetical protein